MAIKEAFQSVTLDKLRREKAKRSLREFSFYIKGDYQEGLPQIELDRVLTDVYEGRKKRVMISMPPRHGKSLKVSQIFPCWVLGKRPKTQIIQTGYSHDISLEQSRHARDLFVSEPCREVFPHVFYTPQRASQNRIPVEKQAAHEWGTMQGGRYYSVGVGGGLTGRGADIALIDDPVKNREEAESPTIREKIWNWYRSTFYTRLSPTGVIILVMTRWHPDDLAGRLLKEMREGGEKWDVVVLEAINNEHQALWPERWPLEKLEEIQRAIGRREFEALYQQSPTLQGGNIFEADNIREEPLTEFPDVRYVRSWDLASSEKERTKSDPDYTAGALVAVTKNNGIPTLWIKDLIYFQKEKPARDEIIRSTSMHDGAEVPVAIEAVAGYKDAWADLKHVLRGKRTVIKVTSSTDKVVRCSVLEPLFENGNVIIPQGVKWRHDLITQFADFPSGTHDDIVDCITTGYKYFEKFSGGTFDRSHLRI